MVVARCLMFLQVLYCFLVFPFFLHWVGEVSLQTQQADGFRTFKEKLYRTDHSDPATRRRENYGSYAGRRAMLRNPVE